MLDDYTFTLFKSGLGYPVTSLIGAVSRKTSLDLLGEEFSFAQQRSLSVHDSKVKIEVGDGLLMKNGDDEIFRGIIVDEGENGIFQYQFVAFDYAFYLNKSTTTIQFRGIACDQAVKALCRKFGVPIGFITPIKARIKFIYMDKPISEIIKDLLQKATDELGIKYRIEMRSGKLYIEQYTELVVKATFKPAPNIAEVDVTKLIGNYSRSRSISDMVNSIVITSGNEKNYRIAATAKDDDNIKRYGLIEQIFNFSDKDDAQLRNIAKNKLTELNNIIEKNDVQLLGDDRVRAGRILRIDDKITGFSNYYSVTSCTHTYNKGIHLMQLSLEKTTVEGVA